MRHRDLKAWRLMHAGSVACLAAAGAILLTTLALSAEPHGTAMSTLHSVISAFALG